jgi:MFS family permease
VPNGQKSAYRWVALVVLLAGGFMPPLDFFIVNVALSSIHERLNAAPAELQLVISGYACGYGVFLITGGRLGTCLAASGVS